MDTRGGGTIRNLGLLVVIASVLVLGYRYTKLLAKFEEQSLMLNERQFEIRSVQEENDGMQKQISDCETRKAQCVSDVNKVKTENQEKITTLENKVKDNENKVNECEKQKNEKQSQLDACNKDKENQVNQLKKEKDDAQKKVNDLQAEIGKLNEQLKAAQEANKPAAAQQNPPANDPAKSGDAQVPVEDDHSDMKSTEKDERVKFDPEKEEKRVENLGTGKTTGERLAKENLLKVESGMDRLQTLLQVAKHRHKEDSAGSKKSKERLIDEEKMSNKKEDVTRGSHNKNEDEKETPSPEMKVSQSRRTNHRKESTAERVPGPPTSKEKKSRSEEEETEN